MVIQNDILENTVSHSRLLIESTFNVVYKYESEPLKGFILSETENEIDENRNFFNVRKSYMTWKLTKVFVFNQDILSKLDAIYDILTEPASKNTFDWYIQFRIVWVLTEDDAVAEKLFPYPTSSRIHFKKLEIRKIIEKDNRVNINGYSFEAGNVMLLETWIANCYMLEGKCEPKPNEIVIDAGAYQGETAIWFADAVGKEGKVFAFEIISSNIDVFKKNIQRNNMESYVYVIDKGLWDENTIIFAEDDSYRSKCNSKKMGASIQVVTLDSFVQENNLDRIDYIKMDIEGAEMRALKGAQNTIKKYKPKLAICVYHLDSDIINIPILIKSLVPEYHISLSQKVPYYNTAVIFAYI